MRSKHPVRESLIFLACVLFAIFAAFPIYWMINTALSTDQELYTGQSLWPHLERVLLRNIELDPAPALWNDPAVVGFAIARFGVGDEVDTGRAVQLADDDTFSTVDDELTATEHDGDVAEIDLFLNGLVARQSQPHAQRAAIGEAQLAAFIGIVARLPQLVADILELHGAIVALDREDLPQNTLDPLVLPLQRRGVVLEEAVVKAGLDFG